MEFGALTPVWLLINAAPPPHGKKMSQKMKRKAAGWDLNYLLNIMFGVA